MEKKKKKKESENSKIIKKEKFDGLTVNRRVLVDNNTYSVNKNNVIIKKKFGREFFQLLDDKGRIKEEIETRGRNKTTIIKKIRQDGTMKDGLKKVRLAKVSEYIDDDFSLKNLKEKEKFQVAYTVSYNGKSFTARSSTFIKGGKNMDFAQQHGLYNLQRKLSYMVNGQSDSELGAKLIKDKKLKIRRSIIYYRNK